ncbi:MAG: hypothetical protein AABY46_07465 [Nitrospirota bacterium]
MTALNNPKQNRWLIGIHGNVLLLGIVSFFNDAAAFGMGASLSLAAGLLLMRLSVKR